jgi:hypothetical protein
MADSTPLPSLLSLVPHDVSRDPPFIRNNNHPLLPIVLDASIGNWTMFVTTAGAAQQLLSKKRHEMSRYILEDLLDCPVNSHFMVCVSADSTNLEHGDYYAKKATMIANKLKCAGLETKLWRISGQKYIVIHGMLDRSSHFFDIKLKSISRRQFVDAFENESGNFCSEI